MTGSTKKTIIASFMHLAAKKPLEKITVRDIVDDCGINRNTFYYHFQDIYAVLEAVCLGGTTAGINTALPLGEMLCELFLVLTAYAERHHKAVQHIAASIGQSGAERYFAAGFDAPVYEVLQKEAPHAPDDMLRTATVFLRHAFIGLYVDFIHAGGKINSARLSERIALLSGGIVHALRSAAPTPFSAKGEIK